MNNDTKQRQLEVEELETKIRGMVSERQYISYIIEEAESKLKTLKTGWKIFYYLNIFGEIAEIEADNYNEDVINQMKEQGNTFKTREDAEKERDRRELLYEFNQFKNDCNGGWNPDWGKQDAKYFLYYSHKFGVFSVNSIRIQEMFHTFGYFKNEKDAQRTIDLFGDRIKKLYID